MILTLDHNAIINLEKGEEPEATALRTLAVLCAQQGHRFATYSYLWLENPRKGQPRDLTGFAARLEALGIGPIEMLPTPTFPSLNARVHSVVFPGLPYRLHA